MARRKQPVIADALLDQLLAGGDAKAAFDKDGLLDELKKALAERVLNAEMDHHLGAGEENGNSRNGYGRKTGLTETSKMALDIPRDCLSTFDPQLIAKYQRRFPGFDEKIVSMYARGMSTCEIQGHLRALYGIDVSPDLIRAVTDDVLEEVSEWQNRPLEALYALIFVDAIRIKVGDEGTVKNKAVYVALGVRADGTKEILGLWIEQSEGAKFCLRVMNELKTRGVEDVLIAIVDGLKGLTLARPLTCTRGNRGGLSAGPGADLRRASHPPLSGLCLLQGPQSGGGSVEANLLKPRTPMPARLPSMTSLMARGARNIRQSPNPGGGTGRK